MQADERCGRAPQPRGSGVTLARGDDDIVDELGRVEPCLHRRDETPELPEHRVIIEGDGKLAEKLVEIHTEIPRRRRPQAVCVQQAGDRSVAEDVDVA